MKDEEVRRSILWEAIKVVDAMNIEFERRLPMCSKSGSSWNKRTANQLAGDAAFEIGRALRRLRDE